MLRSLLFLLFLLVLSSCGSSVTVDDIYPVYKVGDSAAWADPKYPDTGWAQERGVTGKQIFWMRAKVNIRNHADKPIGVLFQHFGAFEVYWDGVYVGHNGEIEKQGKPEVPGYATSYFILPDSLTNMGMHTLALRTSQVDFTELQRDIGIKLDTYANLLRKPLLLTSLLNLMAGAFLIASIYYFFLYVNSRQKQSTTLIFAFLCLFFFILIILEYSRSYIDIPYTHFFIRLKLIGWLTFAIAMLIPLYFSIHFNFKWKVQILTLLFVTLLIIYIVCYDQYDLTARLYSLVMWIVSVIIVLNAIFRKERGAIVVLLGFLASATVNNFFVYDFGLFISFTIIVVCMLYLHTIRTKIIEEEHQSSLLLSSRLQLELIKKNIQPHFLRNTLTSLIDWVEESPKEGSKFIQALSDEFDIMNSISEEALIPIRQEIALCKKHLYVMQFRKEIQYDWEDSGIDDADHIPPAVIHTILENGITHSMPRDGNRIGFKLSYSYTNGVRQYIFETNGVNRTRRVGNVGGNGFRYVEARLAESYGSNWEFKSEASASGWVTTIRIFDHKRR